MKISGSKVLLTGASGGLGEAIARDLRSRGATLTLTGRREDQLRRLADSLDAETLVADLCDDDGLARVTEESKSHDVLIVNAGTGNDSPLEEMTIVEVDAAIGVNLRAPILLATEFAKAHLQDGTNAQVVFIGSLSGLVTSPNTRLYNATKFGLRGFALSLRQDLENTGVGVSIVEPGFIRGAGMFASSGMDLPAGVRTKAPQDVARVVARAIKDNPVEAFVAPIELRLGAAFGAVAPAIAAKAQKLAGASEITAGRS